MYNTDLPKRADLPTSAQLKRSTIIAATAALAILVTVVMPSEYATDPTGAGRLLGLTKMGEIKTQLAAEAAADAAADNSSQTAARLPANASEGDLLARLDRMEKLLVGLTEQQPATQPAVAQQPVAQDDVVVGEITPDEAMPAEEPEPQVAATEEPAAQAAGRRDEMTFTLAPGQGVEIKLVMREGAKANFAWIVDGGVVNFDTHGDNSNGQKVSYEKGRSVPSGEGTLEAAFDGNHGWFWRNRGNSEVSVTLQTQGDYVDIKRMI